MNAHVMLDLETMGTGNNAAIIAIGAAAFDKDGVRARYYNTVSLESSIAVGMQMDASTVMWWLQQSEDARKALLVPDQVPLATALEEFSEFYLTYAKGGGVWGNGATFDNTVIGNAYRLTGIKRPWSFRLDRCYRTVREMHPPLALPMAGTAHNALDDAVYQARYLIKLGVL